MKTPTDILNEMLTAFSPKPPPSMFDGRIYIELPPSAVLEAVRQQISRELGREVEIETGSFEGNAGIYVTTKKPTPPAQPNASATSTSNETADLLS